MYNLPTASAAGRPDDWGHMGDMMNALKDPGVTDTYAWTEPFQVMSPPAWLPDADVLEAVPNDWADERFNIPTDVSKEESDAMLSRRRDYCEVKLNCIRQMTELVETGVGCSFAISGQNALPQLMVKCVTCNMDNICLQCRGCHEGHSFAVRPVVNPITGATEEFPLKGGTNRVVLDGYCECGKRGPESCKCISVTATQSGEALVKCPDGIESLNHPVVKDAMFPTRKPKPTQAPVAVAAPAPATASQASPAAISAPPAAAAPPTASSAATVQAQRPVAPLAAAVPATGVQGRALYQGLKITIVDAVLYTAADSNGLADPYVKLKQNGNKLLKTKVIKKTLKPTWNESKAINVTGDNGVIRIGVEVWDQDTFANDFMCRGEMILHADQQGRVFVPGSATVTLKNRAGKDDGVLNFKLG